MSDGLNGMRKICVVTGTRAEYGLLRYLLQEIKDDPELQLQLIATGMHLSPEFGLTYQAIEEDGFVIDAKVEMLLSSDTPMGIAKSMGLGTIGMADALARLQPDIIVLLGDRFEILAAAQAAMVARIPIAHLHGGETTEGAFDEAIRHAVTKMSHLHFVAAEAYGQRVVQMGESPERVYNFGAPGLDWFGKLTLLGRAELAENLGIQFSRHNFLVTFHPATLSNDTAAEFDHLLEALKLYPDATVVFSFAQAHPRGGGRVDIVHQQGE